MGGIEPRSGQGELEGSPCEGTQQVYVERFERNPFYGRRADEGIDQEKFDTLTKSNFSNWGGDVRKTLNVEPAVIVRLQNRLADRPEVKGWIEKPDDFPAESSQPDVAPPESTAKSAISKRHVAQGLTSELLEMHKDKRHATYEAMRPLKVRKSRARTHTHLRFAFHSLRD